MNNGGVTLVVRGDVFTALSTDEGLDRYGKEMVKAFDVELRGRLGTDKQDENEIKLLNRILRISSTGLKYEADPRHAELLARALGLEGCKEQPTPGTKDCLDSEIAGGLERDEAHAKEEIHMFICSLMPNIQKSKPTVNFSDSIEIIKIPDAETHFAVNPRTFVLSGPIGKTSPVMLSPWQGPYTGLAMSEVDATKDLHWQPRHELREQELRRTLLQGPRWEKSTAAILASLVQKSSPKPKRKFAKKRVGGNSGAQD